MKSNAPRIAALGLALLFFLGCNQKRNSDTVVRMATTTSTENSGLLAHLLPEFKRDKGITVHVIAAGTGKALKHGRNGDVDLLLVHAREDEIAFVDSGYGVDRREVMYNDFVLIGPKEDPAGIGKATSAAEAFRFVKESQSKFISRGDESGTHKKEQRIWRAAGLEPKGNWFLSSGQSMGAAIIMANQIGAYALADRATFLAFESKIDLVIIYEGDNDMLNHYGIMAVNPDRHKEVRYKNAAEFIEWITSPKGRQMIQDFRVNKKQFFFPAPAN